LPQFTVCLHGTFFVKLMSDKYVNLPDPEISGHTQSSLLISYKHAHRNQT